MSVATDEMRKRQQDHPPLDRDLQGNVIDRSRLLFSVLRPHLPSWATERYDFGTVVVGEIGLSAPDAFVETYSDGSYGIFFTSGFLHVVQEVALDFASTLAVLPDGTAITPTLSSGDAVFRSSAVLDQYRTKRLSQGFSLDTYPLELPPQTNLLGYGISRWALVFVLAHELGHIAEKINGRSEPTESAEFAADTTAFTLLVAAAARVDLSITYIGAYFALRLLTCLERGGFTFRDLGTSMTLRLERLKQLARAMIMPGHIRPEDIAWTEAHIELFFAPIEQLLQFTRDSQDANSQAKSESTKAPAPAAAKPSKATIELRAMVQRSPPWEYRKDGKPLDRTEHIRELLHSLLPHHSRSLLDSGQIVVGEVGESAPVSTLDTFDDGSRLITFNSGLLSLLECVSQFLHTRVSVTRNGNPESGAIFSQQMAAHYIADVFRELGRGKMGRAAFSFALPGAWQPRDLLIDHTEPDPFLDAQQLHLARQLGSAAAGFLLLSRICEAISPSAINEQSTALSLHGIALSSRQLGEGLATTLFAGSTARLGFRNTYPAVLVAVRVRRCIEQVAPSLPTGGIDLESVNRASWRMCGSTSAFEYMQGIGRAFDALMESVEIILKDEVDDVADGAVVLIDRPAEERLWLEESLALWLDGGISRCALGEEAPETVLQYMRDAIKDVSANSYQILADALFARVIMKLSLEAYLPEQGIAEKKLEIYEWLIGQLPEPARMAFGQARSKNHHN